MPSGPHSRLVYSTGGELPRPADPPQGQAPARPGSQVRIRLDRRASGRVVTLVTGLGGSSAEVGELARVLKSACGAGGTVKDGILEIQGDHREKVEAVLKARGRKSKRAGG